MRPYPSLRQYARIVLLIVVLASGSLAAAPASAAPPGPATIDSLPVPGACQQGQFPPVPLVSPGAYWKICVPTSGWNGDVIAVAHGYAPPGPLDPNDLHELVLPDGGSLSDLVQSLGYAYATTSYKRNGLAILEGVDDMRDLVGKFVALHGQPGRVYIVGASEGGIVTALSAEQSSDIFSAGLSLCGPIGDFRRQINYWDDFRALYDYFFPGALPADAVTIPAGLIENWDTLKSQAVGKLSAQPLKAAQLLATSGAPFDVMDRNTILQTAEEILWYNVFATNDGKHQLGGNPYDNRSKVYRGSFNDYALNRPGGITRYTADQAALNSMVQYETSGNPQIPLVTMHTTGDPVIPYWHQTAYRQKVRANGNTGVTQIPIFRYGHCSFTTNQVLVGFALMVLKATGSPMFVPPQYNITETQGQMESSALQ